MLLVVAALYIGAAAWLAWWMLEPINRVAGTLQFSTRFMLTDVIGTTTNYYSSDRFAVRLGAFDQFAAYIEVLDAQYTGTASIIVGVEHCGEGVHWTTKSSGFLVWDATSNPTNYDDATLPSLPFVRFRLQATGDRIGRAYAPVECRQLPHPAGDVGGRLDFFTD